MCHLWQIIWVNVLLRGIGSADKRLSGVAGDPSETLSQPVQDETPLVVDAKGKCVIKSRFVNDPLARFTLAQGGCRLLAFGVNGFKLCHPVAQRRYFLL